MANRLVTVVRLGHQFPRKSVPSLAATRHGTLIRRGASIQRVSYLSQLVSVVSQAAVLSWFHRPVPEFLESLKATFGDSLPLCRQLKPRVRIDLVVVPSHMTKFSSLTNGE